MFLFGFECLMALRLLTILFKAIVFSIVDLSVYLTFFLVKFQSSVAINHSNFEWRNCLQYYDQYTRFLQLAGHELIYLGLTLTFIAQSDQYHREYCFD